MSAQFDFHEVNQLSASLNGVAGRQVVFVRKAVEVSARHVKDSAKKRAKDDVLSGHAKLYPYTIDYEMLGERDSISAEVGPRLGGQGSLGHILEYGSPTSPPQPTLEPAMQDNVDDFVKGVEIAVEDALKEAGF